MLRASRNGPVPKVPSMHLLLNIARFDPWQRSLFSHQQTAGKEPQLAGKGLITLHSETKPQGCGLRKITWSAKAPNHEILGTQPLSLYEKSKFFPFVQRQKLVTCGTWAPLEHSPALDYGKTNMALGVLRGTMRNDMRFNGQPVLSNISHSVSVLRNGL